MFAKSQEEYLIRRFNRNEVLLFLGAGFSKAATNKLDENFPVGTELTKKIWEFMYPSIPFVDDGTSLQDIYQALIKSGKSNADIENFLLSNLTVKRYPDYYKYLLLIKWFKIYTINIDDLLDKIFPKWGNEIENFVYPTVAYKERDQLLEKLQIIYLHGKLPCELENIIFSRTQYADSLIKLQPLYFHFINEYSNLPTIFIGTTLNEILFDQYIATRQSIKKGVHENRPKSFLIIPEIPVIKERVFKNEYNIEVVRGTAGDFLNWLASISDKLLSKEDILKNLFPIISKLQNHPKFKQYNTESVHEFSQSFISVDLSIQFPPKKKNYLLGTSPMWADIHYNLDAPRKITSVIKEKIESLFNGDLKTKFIAVLGTAGSGKSTVLKRLCSSLVSHGRTVYHSYSQSLPSVEDLVEVLNMVNEKVVLAFDNAELILRQVSGMVEELDKVKNPPIIIFASRTNVFDRIISQNNAFQNLEQFHMPNLDRDEIIEIIKKLDENNLLGHLRGLNATDRIKEFENKAKKQILVAMREATEGKDFETIMKSEFEEIGSEEGKLLCLCVSLTTDAGFTITKQDFTSFSSKPPAEALDLLERNLKGLVLKAGVKEDRLLLRHRTIADFFIDNCAAPEYLKQAYLRVLSSLASEINNSTLHSRKFSLYIEIINHYTVYKRFSKNIEKAREVYESLVDYFKDDFHFWLQYGSLELEGAGGNLELAENYLNQAYSLKSTSIFVRNALAYLYYKKSLEASSKNEADSLKDEADSILINLMKDRYSNDPYTYHIFGRGNYDWILKWVTGRDPVKKSLQDLQKIINQGLELFPNNKRLAELQATLLKAIMMTAVEGDNINYPVLHSEFGNY